MKKNDLTQAWLVLVLALCFGGGLAAVQSGLQPMIEKNKLAETSSQIPGLVPGAASGAPQQVGDLRVYKAVDDQDQTVGYVLPTGGQGFADRIEILIGYNATLSEITGLYVLDQKETPGLGNKIVEDKWRAQFCGKKATRPVTIVKGKPTADNEVQAVTGATISSDAVAGIVNKSSAKIRAALLQEVSNGR